MQCCASRFSAMQQRLVSTSYCVCSVARVWEGAADFSAVGAAAVAAAAGGTAATPRQGGLQMFVWGWTMISFFCLAMDDD